MIEVRGCGDESEFVGRVGTVRFLEGGDGVSEEIVG